MFGKAKGNGNKKAQHILRNVGIAYFLIVIALVGLVAWRQTDAAQKQGRQGLVNKLSLQAERAVGYASIIAGTSGETERRFDSKLSDTISGWKTTSKELVDDLKGTPEGTELEKTGKALLTSLDAVRNSSTAATQAAAAERALKSQQAYAAALAPFTGSNDPKDQQNELLLTAGLVAGVALLLTFLVFQPLLRNARKGVEFEQARFINEKEREFAEKTKEATDRMVGEIRAKQEEMKAQAEALEVALSRAEEVNRLKTAFLANMSHEIRTPMNHVIGMAELLSQTSLTTEQREWLRTIISSGNQLLTIINDILDLSQVEAGKLALDPQRFNLRELVTDAVRPFEAEAREKNLSMAVWLAASVTEEVISDPVRIRQILTNLISNAIKFTSVGRIDVSAETVKMPDGHIDVRLSVKDTGIGIEPARLKAIFDSFTQADSSTKRVYGGTGLGLTIVRQIAELMGGSVDVRSAPGMGSEFTVTIPADAIDEAPRSINPSAPASVVDLPTLKMRCLVVEDNLVNQKVLVKLLEKLGCTVETVDDGEAAVQKTLGQTYDVILMDIHMPGKDGIEATRDIRERERQWKKSPTPIVAVTADAMQEDRQRFIDAGMDDYVAKPVRQATLVPILSRFCKVSVA